MPPAALHASITLGALVVLAGCMVACGSPSSSASRAATTAPAAAGTPPFPVVHARIIGSTDKADAITALAARDTTVWIDVDDNLLASTDSGAHWVWRAMMPTGVTSLTFGSSQDAWAASPDGLFRTADAGESWQPVASVHDAVARVRFVDAMHGWITAKSGGLQRTSDGGATWTTVTDPCALDSQNVFGDPIFSFYDPAHGWAICHGVGANLNESKDLFRTDDGGMHWNLVSWFHWANMGTPAPIPLPSSPTSDLVVLDAQHAWTGSDVGGVLETDDGAESWHDSSFRAAADEVAFTTATRGYALAGREVLYAVDGEAAQTTAYALPSAPTVFAPHPTNYHIASLPGYSVFSELPELDGLWVIATPCAAGTWPMQAPGMRPPPAGDCIHSQILFSADRGDTWVQVALPDGLIGELSESNGHIHVSSRGITLETTDAGRTWTRIWPALVHHN